MLKPRTMCGLVAALMLCAVPAMASIPPEVAIRLGGAEQLGRDHYVVIEASTVTVAVSAPPGGIVWLYATGLNASGEPDGGELLTLILQDNPNGTVSSSFVVPKRLAGRKFQLEAQASDADGDIHSSTTVLVDVVGPEDSDIVADSVLGG